uniref:Type I restriction-modification system, specificity subunit S n=1 Tax=Rheinheimera sp. BAL341 TaxID=1708203 RepID=A0A486XFM9_9GAMM
MVPKGWYEHTLDELALVERGKFSVRPRNDPRYYGGHMPFVQTGDVTSSGTYLSGYSQTLNEDGVGVSKVFPKDTILITIAANIGDTAITVYEVACPDSVVAIQPYKDVADVYWLKKHLETRKADLDAQSTQNAQKNINLQVLKPLLILTPPLPEQRKIAAILSTWDKAITTTEQLLANSQQQKKALMQQLLTGKKRLLDENGERFRGEWKWSKVSDLLKVRKEKQVPTEDIPLFSLTIEDGVTPKSDRYNREFLVKNTDEKKYKLVNPKDIVYNPANLRWGAINFSRIDHSVVVSPIYEVLFLKDENKTSLEFIAQKLMTPDQIGRFAAMVEGTLVERMAVKIEPFLATKLSVPPTLEEQQKIASVLTVADEEISALQQKIETLKQEKKALMQQLLTGKRRVKVDEVAA